MTAAGAIIVFLREPVPGKVKTRLAASIGEHAAVAVYRQLVDITLAAAGSTSVPVYLCYDGLLPATPDRNPGFMYDVQALGDLGARMMHALATVQAIHGRVVLIGSDCPEITTGLLREALETLRTVDVVLGPAADGGYYLIGLSGPPQASLFSDIPWSSHQVFAMTVERCAWAGLSVSVMPLLSDIDTLDDLVRFPRLFPHTAVESHP